MNVRDRQLGAAALKRLRLSRGWSLAGAARAIAQAAEQLGRPLEVDTASVQRCVARWESPRSAILPGDRYQLLLAYVYARTPGGQYILGPGSDFAELLDALAYLGAGSDQLRELRVLCVRTVTDDGTGLLALLGPTTQRLMADALADPSRTDEALVDGLRAVVADVNQQVGTVPFVRLQLLLAPVVESCRRLLSGPVPDGLLHELRSIAAQTYTLAGRLAFETRDDGASRALYAAATGVAGRLDDPWRRAVVHMSHSLVTLYSTPGIDAARLLVDEAVRDARAGGSVIVRARAHALQAEVAARAGAAKHARAALSLAWYDMDGDQEGDPSVSSFSPAHLRGFEGLCELYVGDPAVAHETFAQSARALTAPRERVQHAIVATDQALARLKLNEPHAAADLLHQCIDDAVTTGGRVASIRLRRARRELRPWRAESFVADLDDHLIESVGR
ncbi:hypothetical protein JK364_41670 [Streptomyces sp. 110]|uniref:Transcriptional regulator n=1 Tax=Streptomyces endocoffeicus TaxID=2898945 RepID=A0ABS1Q2F6_9ACTN|nr:hypothetical protein [Streptomyces endocoffeicus]MBL1118827.1 hypothetical protein [Streptomyces endocoffeicus]